MTESKETKEYTENWNRLPLLPVVNQFTNFLTTNEKQFIATQIGNIMESYYTHYLQKTSALAIDPVQEAKLLYNDAPTLYNDMDFFKRAIQLITKLRDRHTCFTMPQPWASLSAILPFMAEAYFDGMQQKIIVTKVAISGLDKDFKPGAEILYWNGSPMNAYIQNLSLQNSGAHVWARNAFAIRLLTSRPLAYYAPPEADWVQLVYRSEGKIKTIVIPWKIYDPSVYTKPTIQLKQRTGKAAKGLGLDDTLYLANSTLRAIHSADQFTKASTLTKVKVDPKNNLYNSQDIVFYTAKAGSATFGYVRIYSFDFEKPVQFVSDFGKILQTMPQSGLIIDVRSNPGGYISAGEGLAQLFSEKPINPALLAFRSTDKLQQMANSLSDFTPWRKSLDLLLETGQNYSQGYPLTEMNDFSSITYRFKGKVAVIIDALCYSTTDFFAAAMQDNGLGLIIGTDPKTGAGGANVWSLLQLSQELNSAGNHSIQMLPKGADLSIAMINAIRTGPYQGLPIEDLGVNADLIHYMTLDDIIHHNSDLIKFACNALSNPGAAMSNLYNPARTSL